MLLVVLETQITMAEPLQLQIQETVVWVQVWVLLVLLSSDTQFNQGII
jgi:hypothetical protein